MASAGSHITSPSAICGLASRWRAAVNVAQEYFQFVTMGNIHKLAFDKLLLTHKPVAHFKIITFPHGIHYPVLASTQHGCQHRPWPTYPQGDSASEVNTELKD